MHYLVVYDRSAGKLLLPERAFANRTEAMQARYDIEKLHRGDSNVEAVVLDAESEAALRRTHARYFMSLAELADQARGDDRRGQPVKPRANRYSVGARAVN